jgi:hypothetical protein
MRYQAGYRGADIRAFQDRLTQATSTEHNGAPESIRFEDFMKSSRYSTSEKAAIIRRILKHQVTVYRRSDGAVGNIEIVNSVLEREIGQARALGKGSIVDAVRARKLIECGAEVLNELIQRGLIAGEKRAARWEISEDSVLAFCEAYKKVSAVAQRAHTSPRRVIRVALGAGIGVLVISATKMHSQAFVGASDVCTLARLAERRS